jgi:pilus assembly protein CpaE
VVNRADSKVDLTIRDIERLLEIHVDSRIPSSPLVPRSINQGRLLWFDKRRSDVAKGVEALADRLVAKLTPESVVPTNGAHRRRRR